MSLQCYASASAINRHWNSLKYLQYHVLELKTFACLHKFFVSVESLHEVVFCV